MTQMLKCSTNFSLLWGSARASPSETREAGASIKPGVERSGTPGQRTKRKASARSVRHPKVRNTHRLPLSPASRALSAYSYLSWGFASLHPRLYAHTRFAGSMHSSLTLRKVEQTLCRTARSIKIRINPLNGRTTSQ